MINIWKRKTRRGERKERDLEWMKDFVAKTTHMLLC